MNVLNENNDKKFNYPKFMQVQSKFNLNFLFEKFGH